MSAVVDFIGVGAPRCGTSWLSNILRAHPDVCLSDPKEIRYFNRLLPPIGAARGKPNPNAEKGVDWYLAHFAHVRDGQICGEFSPNYLCDEAAPEAIRQVFPSAKLIVNLRNPIDRAYSHYCQTKRVGQCELPTFEQAIEQQFGYLEVSLYAKQLTRYLDCFDRDQIFVTVFEELVSSPTTEIDRVYGFLGITADKGADPARQDANRALSLRSKTVKNFARTTSQALSSVGLGGVQRSLRRLGADRLWHKVMSKREVNPPLSATLRTELESYFEVDVAELERLLDRDFSVWKSKGATVRKSETND